MDDFEEALRNIDIFCKVVVNKMIEDEKGAENKIAVEPMENLLQRKYIIEEHSESNPLAKHLIPLPQAEEPLIDIFEDDNYVKVLVQCRCKDQKFTVHTNMDGIEICKKECHTDDEDIEVCTDRCQKLNLPVKDLQVENMIAKCSNNTVLEVEIPKNKLQ
jgi:hypothetical protein